MESRWENKHEKYRDLIGGNGGDNGGDDEFREEKNSSTDCIQGGHVDSIVQESVDCLESKKSISNCSISLLLCLPVAYCRHLRF